MLCVAHLSHFNQYFLKYPEEYNMEKYVCDLCGYEYDPNTGDPEGNIKPGTQFEDLPKTWVCPLCGVSKEGFKKVK